MKTLRNPLFALGYLIHWIMTRKTLRTLAAFLAVFCLGSLTGDDAYRIAHGLFKSCVNKGLTWSDKLAVELHADKTDSSQPVVVKPSLPPPAAILVDETMPASGGVLPDYEAAPEYQHMEPVNLPAPH